METYQLYKLITHIYYKMHSDKILFKEDLYFSALEKLGLDDPLDQKNKEHLFSFFENITEDDLEYDSLDSLSRSSRSINELEDSMVPQMQEDINLNEYSKNDFINNIIKKNRKPW